MAIGQILCFIIVGMKLEALHFDYPSFISFY